MKVAKQFGLVFGLMPLVAHGAVLLEVAVVRDRTFNSGEPILVTVGQRSKKILENENTYIEAELMTENADEATVQCMVATKNDKNMFVVRGMPRLVVSLKNGLGMASLNCDGDAEHFMIVVAASKK